MLLTYLICLVAGIVLIALALEDEGGLGGDGGGGNLTLLFSTPFWSFGLFGFGLCGLLLVLFAPTASGASSGLVSLGMGLAMGFCAVHMLRLLGRRKADSLVRSEDLIGLEGLVTLELSETERGFVELQARGSLLRRPALSRAGTLPSGTPVVVIASNGNTLSVERL